MQASARRSVLDDTTGRTSEDNAGRRRHVRPADTTRAAMASGTTPDATRADMTPGIRTARPPSPDGSAGPGRHLRTYRPAPPSASAAVTRAVLTAVMLALTAGISVGAGWLSFLAVRDLAVLAGWPAATAWAVQPVVELFLVVGSLEIVCRAWEGRTDLRYPTALLAANVADHMLQAAAERRSGPMLAVIGLLAALVPAAQLGSLHLISGRLHSLGGRTTDNPAAANTASWLTPWTPYQARTSIPPRTPRRPQPSSFPQTNRTDTAATPGRRPPRPLHPTRRRTSDQRRGGQRTLARRLWPRCCPDD